MTDHLKISRDGAVVEITFARPEKKNALSNAMRDGELILAQIARESAIFKERLQTPEAREAFTAFAERRPPDFTKIAS